MALFNRNSFNNCMGDKSQIAMVFLYNWDLLIDMALQNSVTPKSESCHFLSSILNRFSRKLSSCGTSDLMVSRFFCRISEGRSFFYFVGNQHLVFVMGNAAEMPGQLNGIAKHLITFFYRFACTNTDFKCSHLLVCGAQVFPDREGAGHGFDRGSK